MRTTILAGLAATATLVAVSGSMSAQAMPMQPSPIAQANDAISNVVDVQWRRRHWRHRYWGPRFGYVGPRYYSYYRGPYYRPYAPFPRFFIGPRGFGFGIF
jgi:hypothetical protein